MKLYDLVDPYILKGHTDNGLVSVQRHPILPLMIYNYTHKAQYEPHWGDGTIDYCRGLIIDDDYNIIARPFKKFHNLNTQSIPETLEENLPSYEPVVTKKYDGSLGIYWEFNGIHGVATRGSFTSPQSYWATNWLLERKDGYPIYGADGLTPLFEIIYDENRIVVKYDFEGLVLIGAVNKETGVDVHRTVLQQIGKRNNIQVGKSVPRTSLSELKAANIENEEGYVASYSILDKDPLRVKIKMADYVRLHRIVTGLNAHSLWDLLRKGESLDVSKLPEHVAAWYGSWRHKLLKETADILAQAVVLFANRPIWVGHETERQNRARRAAWFFQQKQDHLKSVYFTMLDGQNQEEIDEIIWGMVEPSGADKSFQPAQGEDV